jgi:CRISPR/Cas system-associated exonuclease Cas4 (RecB family)
MPLALSRSRVELFLQCPRCFWLDVRAKLRRPSGPPFSLNVAVDHLLKNEFDRYRGGTTVPPRLAREGLGFVPAAHPELHLWRQNFKGVRVDHPPSGLIVFGAIDDLWADPAGRHYVVDYKATAKADEVGLDAEWQLTYKRQVEFYQWLLRGRGLDVADRAFFVYANGIKDDAPFDDVLRFRTRILAYDGNAHWVEPILMAAAACLAKDEPPGPDPNCEYCGYAEKVGRFGSDDDVADARAA